MCKHHVRERTTRLDGGSDSGHFGALPEVAVEVDQERDGNHQWQTPLPLLAIVGKVAMVSAAR